MNALFDLARAARWRRVAPGVTIRRSFNPTASCWHDATVNGAELSMSTREQIEEIQRRVNASGSVRSASSSA